MLLKAEPTVLLANSSMGSSNLEGTARHQANMVRRLNMGNRNNRREGQAQRLVSMVLRVNMDSSPRSNMVSNNMGNSSLAVPAQDPASMAHKPNMDNSSSKRTGSKETSTAHLVNTAAELQRINFHLLHQARLRASTNRKRMANKAISTAGLALMAV